MTVSLLETRQKITFIHLVFFLTLALCLGTEPSRGNKTACWQTQSTRAGSESVTTFKRFCRKLLYWIMFKFPQKLWAQHVEKKKKKKVNCTLLEKKKSRSGVSVPLKGNCTVSWALFSVPWRLTDSLANWKPTCVFTWIYSFLLSNWFSCILALEIKIWMGSITEDQTKREILWIRYTI